MRNLWYRFKGFLRRASRKAFTKRNVAQVAVTVGTTALSYGVLRKWVPPWMAMFSIGIVLIHEFGHYFSALRHRERPFSPIVIPVPIPWKKGFGITFGVTYVEVSNPFNGAKIALAGPAAGLITSAVLLIGCASIGFYEGAIFCSWMIMEQIMWALFGPDGRKYRGFVREIEVASVQGQSTAPVV